MHLSLIHIYNNLPDLLNDCIIEDASDREQDISRLSELTALSAALPQTFGIYNHKKYSTPLFCVIFSSAGSGKSIAQTGRYLLEEIQAEILSTSEMCIRDRSMPMFQQIGGKAYKPGLETTHKLDEHFGSPPDEGK